MSKGITTSVTQDINASASAAYAVLADYHDGHRRIVSPKLFQDWHVEQGGHGAGTILTYTAVIMGTKQAHRAVVSEPEPSHVLRETEDNLHTTFTVDALDADKTRVNFTTVSTASKGIQGTIERLLMPLILRPYYKEEIRQLERVAREISNTETTVE
jgi:hypothetical protein